MMLLDNMTLAYKNIKTHKSRTLLSLLGIAIGIAAIISLISVGQSLERSITDELMPMVDVIFVIPGQMVPGRGFVPLGAFTEEDVNEVRQIDGVDSAAGWLLGRTKVEFNQKIIPIELTGGDPYEFIDMYEPFADVDGEWLTTWDETGVIIGYSVANDYFDENDDENNERIRVGDEIKINRNRFVVVGIIKGTTFATEVNHQIFAISNTARKILGTDDIMSITVRVYAINDIEAIANEIEDTLNENHNKDKFTTAMTMGAVIEGIGSIILILSAVITGIASIALIVGSIGILNVMLISVMERTREIGIMKAIGATNKDIISLFLIEASIISLIGGIVGVILGMIASIGMSHLLNLPLVLSPIVIIGGIFIAIFIGVVSGVYPAYRAAKMSPVEAVRYE